MNAERKHGEYLWDRGSATGTLVHQGLRLKNENHESGVCTNSFLYFFLIINNFHIQMLMY